jgi:hypothetical protein
MSDSRRNRRENKRSKFALSRLKFHKLDWLEYITIGLALWFLFYPKPYTILFTVLLCLPVLGMLLNGLTGRPSIASLVTISKDREGDDAYDVADFIDIASWAIGIRVLIDFELENYFSIIIPASVAFIIILLVLFATHRQIEQSHQERWWIHTCLFINVIIYCYAGIYGANCIYDDSDPDVYHAEVVGKEERGAKAHSYHLKITPWGHGYDKEELTVSKEQYSEVLIGQTVKIDLKEGLFGIPW